MKIDNIVGGHIVIALADLSEGISRSALLVAVRLASDFRAKAVTGEYEGTLEGGVMMPLGEYKRAISEFAEFRHIAETQECVFWMRHDGKAELRKPDLYPHTYLGTLIVSLDLPEGTRNYTRGPRPELLYYYTDQSHA